MLNNVRALATLHEIVRCGSLAAAAQALRLTPPAVSQQMKALQAEVGFPLFERFGRKNVPTAAAQRLAAATLDHLRAISVAVEDTAGEANAMKGPIVLGGPAPLCRHWLRPRLHELLKLYPELELHVRFEVPSVLAARLVKGEYDFCLLAAPVERTGLTTVQVLVEEFVAIASPAFLRANRFPITADALREQSFAVFDDDLAMLSPWWRTHFGRREPLPSRRLCRVANLDELLALATEALGITVLPRYFVEGALKTKAVVELMPPERSARRREALNPVSLAWRTQAAATARFEGVRKLLLAE